MKKRSTFQKLAGCLLLALALCGNLNAQCSANFNHTVNPNGVVNFAGTSTGGSFIPMYSWDFGDLTTGYGSVQTHTYNGSGNYFVTLTVTDSGSCNTIAIDTIVISGVPCNANTSFAMNRDTITALNWSAYPNYPVNVTSVLWQWGDGSSSNGLYPSHTYSAAGLYQICVIVGVSCGATDTFCLATNIFRSSQSQQMLKVNVVNKTGNSTGIKNVEARNGISIGIRPNPVTDKAHLQIQADLLGDYKFEVYAITGRLSSSGTIRAGSGSASAEIDVQSLDAGLYFITVSNGANHSTLRFVKE